MCFQAGEIGAEMLLNVFRAVVGECQERMSKHPCYTVMCLTFGYPRQGVQVWPSTCGLCEHGCRKQES